jgi:hypothetical protein
MSITWKDKLNLWSLGKDIPDIKSEVFFETSPIDITKIDYGIYNETKVKITKIYNKPNYKPFEKKINQTETRSFLNLDKTCILVIPPYKNKNNIPNYSTLYYFYKNSTYKEKQELWKKVAEEIKKIILKSQKHPSENNKLWVSTHGLGVAWVHIRLSIIPKYYKTKKYITKL